jgi:hypothetical protein
LPPSNDGTKNIKTAGDRGNIEAAAADDDEANIEAASNEANIEAVDDEDNIETVILQNQA